MSKKIKKETKLDTGSKVVIAILVIALASTVGFVLYKGIEQSKTQTTAIAQTTDTVETESETVAISQEEYNKNIATDQYTAPDYSTMEASPSAEDAPTEKLDDVIGYDAYYEFSKKKVKESLDKTKYILGDTLYNQMVAGIETDYFKKATEYDYNDMLNDMDTLLEQSAIVKALYTRYEEDLGYMPEYTTCNIVTKEEDYPNGKCSLLQYIENYTSGDTYDYLDDAHAKWESCVTAEANRNSVSDDYVNIFYQDTICNDYQYIDELKLEVMLINADTADFGLEALQEAYDQGKVETKIYDWTNDTDREAIKSFEFYRDIDYYDDTLRELAQDTITSQFGEEIYQNSYYLGSYSVSDKNDTEELTEAINDMADYVDGNDTLSKDYTLIENWNIETISLADRNERDVIYILWKIVPGSVKHSNLPKLDDIYETLYKKAKLYVASNLVSDTVSAEFNDLDESEVKELLKENYGIEVEDDEEEIVCTDADCTDHTHENTEGETEHTHTEDESQTEAEVKASTENDGGNE